MIFGMFSKRYSYVFQYHKNILHLYSFSEEKEVQNGLSYHLSYKLLVVN